MEVKVSENRHRGIQYILITVYQGNIHLTPRKSRSASDYVSSFASILAFFTAQSLPLLSLFVDNETSLECRVILSPSGCLCNLCPNKYTGPTLQRGQCGWPKTTSSPCYLPPTMTSPTTSGTAFVPTPKSPSTFFVFIALILSSLPGRLHRLQFHTTSPPTHFIPASPSPVPITTFRGTLTGTAQSFILGPALTHYRCHRTYLHCLLPL
jgi:hypothetical protein